MNENPDIVSSGNVQEQSDLPAPDENQPFWKRIPWLTIPAIIMLVILVIIFAATLYSSFFRFSIKTGLFNGDYIGTLNYARHPWKFYSGARNTLIAKALVLGVSSGLAALLCLLYYTMKKPKTILTAACLWLIPSAIPTVIMAAATVFPIAARRWLYSAAFLTGSMGLQTLAVFCFAGGLFAWQNLRKTGRVGKGPFMGLLVAVLVYLLGSLSTSGVYSATIPSNYTPLLDKDILDFTTANLSVNSAMSVSKILVQLAIGLIPMFFLVRMAKKDPIPAPRATRTELWLIPAAIAGILLALFAGSLANNISGSLEQTLFVTAIITLAGAAVGGLAIWSIIRLSRHSCAWLYGILFLVLSASFSNNTIPYVLSSRLGFSRTLLINVLYAAVDWRLILLAGILVFVLRSESESGFRPGKLALALVLLSGAFAWGSLTAVITMSIPPKFPLSYEFFGLFAKRNDIPAETLQQARLLLLLPPLVISAGAALLMRQSFSD